MADSTGNSDEILNDVLVALGVANDDAFKSDKSKVIKLYIKLATKSVQLYVGEFGTDLPDALTGVVTEMSMAKFAKSGDEGKLSSTEEGLSSTWNADDMTPYISQLNSYMANKANGGSRGWVKSYD